MALINIGAAVGDGTGTPGPRTWSQFINRLPNPTSTINADSGDYSGTTEQKITAAIAAAAAAGAKYVFVPQSMLPYNASLVTFNSAIKMTREGGPSHAYDVMAYGADPAQASGAAANAASFNAAITAAAATPGANANDAKFVWVPALMLGTPYQACVASITFNTKVRMLREGGNPTVYDVQAYGADAGGNNDSTVAVAACVAQAGAAINFAQGQAAQIYFASGQYLTTTGFAFNAVSDLEFIGDGPNSTRIFMGSNVNGLAFTGVCTRITIRDMWIGTPTNNSASGTALSVIGTVGTHSDSFLIENVVVQNAPVPFFFQYLDNSRMRRLRYYQSRASATTQQVYMLDTCITVFAFECDNFVTAGALPSDVYVVRNDCDTVDLIGCVALSGTGYGFSISNPSGTSGPRLCRLTNCYSESNTLSGFSISGGRDVRLTDCHAAINLQNGFAVTGGVSVSLLHNFSLQNSQHGIAVTGGTSVGLIANTCSNNSQQTTTTYDGIRIENNVVGVRCLGNRSGDFVFTLTNKQRYGISIGAVGTDFHCVTENDLQNNTTGALGNFSAGVNNIVTRNIGVTPSGVSAITVTASPFTYTNVGGVPQMVYVDGGTVTTVVKNGVTVFSFGAAAARAAVALEPNEAVTVTYTVAPTMNKDSK